MIKLILSNNDLINIPSENIEYEWNFLKHYIYAYLFLNYDINIDYKNFMNNCIKKDNNILLKFSFIIQLKKYSENNFNILLSSSKFMDNNMITPIYQYELTGNNPIDFEYIKNKIKYYNIYKFTKIQDYYIHTFIETIDNLICPNYNILDNLIKNNDTYICDHNH